MTFYLTGVDYKRAPLAVREEVYRKRKKIDEYLYVRHPGGAAILYTCNRTEFYGVAKGLFEARVSIDDFQDNFSEFSRYGYTISGKKAFFRHILRLAAGLESQIKGEPQILQQLYGWHLQDSFSPQFSALVRKALSSARDIRIKSGLDRVEDNIATLVSKNLIKRIKGEKCLQVVIVGTGKIAELFSGSRYPQFRFYFVSHRNYEKARELAGRSNAEALMLKDLPEILLRADALISATSSPHFLFDKEYFRKVLVRRDRPLYLYDLAVPRDIKPDAGILKGIVLNNLDTLVDVFNEHNESLRANILLAGRMIEEHINGDEEINNEEDFEDGDAAEPLSLKTG